MSDILKRIDAYLMVNEGSSKHLQPWLNMLEHIFDDMEEDYAQIISDDMDEENEREMERYIKKMSTYCKNGKIGAQKVANAFDKIANQAAKFGISPNKISVNIYGDVNLLGCVAAMKFEAWSLDLDKFVDALRKELIKFGSIYKDNNKNSYLYQDKNTVYLAFGDYAVKSRMPDYNEDFAENYYAIYAKSGKKVSHSFTL